MILTVNKTENIQNERSQFLQGFLDSAYHDERAEFGRMLWLNLRKIILVLSTLNTVECTAQTLSRMFCTTSETSNAVPNFRVFLFYKTYLRVLYITIHEKKETFVPGSRSQLLTLMLPMNGRNIVDCSLQTKKEVALQCSGDVRSSSSLFLFALVS